MKTVLIYYGTSEGQTAKIAGHIGRCLVARGLGVEIIEAPAVPSLSVDRYDAVLVGDSIHVGRFHPPVLDFIDEHREVLSQRPNGFFSVCLSAASKKPQERAYAKLFIDTMIDRTDWHPERSAVFAGALTYSKYGMIKRWVMKRIAKANLGDIDTSRDYEYTDWGGVEAFANGFCDNIVQRAA